MQPLSVFNMSIQCKGYAHGMKVAMFRVASYENSDRFLLVPTRPKTSCKQGSKQCKQRRILKRLHRLQIRTGSNLLQIVFPPFFSLKSRCLGSSSSGAASSYLYFPWRSRSLLTSQVKIPPGGNPWEPSSQPGLVGRNSCPQVKKRGEDWIPSLPASCQAHGGSPTVVTKTWSQKPIRNASPKCEHS